MIGGGSCYPKIRSIGATKDGELVVSGSGGMENSGGRFRYILAGSWCETGGVGTGTSRVFCGYVILAVTEENLAGNREKQNR